MAFGWTAKLIAFVAVAAVLASCSASTSHDAQPSSPAVSAVLPHTTVAPTTTTLGTRPPGTVNGMRMTRAPAPLFVPSPGATWYRLDRPDGHVQLVALYRPKKPGRHPVVVYLHGSSGLAATELRWSPKLAAKGFIVVTGCYLDVAPFEARGAPAYWVPCPSLEINEQVPTRTTIAAYEALVDFATALPDAGPVGVVGVSYGAILALSVHKPRVKAIVADSGYGKLGLSPVRAPVLMLGIENDPNVDHIRLVFFEAAARAAHKNIDSHYYPGDGHVATLQVLRPDVGIDATARTAKFLKRWLR